MYKRQDKIDVLGLGGDPLHAPSNTIPSFWASLAGGAAGFVCNVQMSKDKFLFCAEHHYFKDASQKEINYSDLTWEKIKELDAGERFHSMEIDESDVPTGSIGSDRPWAANRESQRLRHA